MIDTHCHLQVQPLVDNLKAILARAKAAGVTKIIVPAINPADFDWIAKHINTPSTYFALGVHPSQVKDDLSWPKISLQIRNLIQIYPHKIVAIGEIGLDQKINVDLKLQINWFKHQLTLARKLNLPVIIHNRQADKIFSDLFKTLKPWPSAVFHAFTGSSKWLTEIINHKFYIGLGGLILKKGFDSKNWTIIQKHLDLIVTETDSPYLLPEPVNRDEKFNQPANVKIITKFIADKIGLSPSQITALTSQNAIKLFNL